ncbi:hypothetical protein Pla123a_08060 [Posidoniimonas polymericola]|uniref:1,4-alpha-glucan branching enzyme n=1 Tax=Posidoniimonas polymericola TaxID=2528002 RepID=A0A5C5ZFM5_9BACT|nr:hypothetical protein [Posidoniimonas polymericola]TWT85998.1 hypothetical protein Pla123a_08060 [Posidoniimonas polymericola]
MATDTNQTTQHDAIRLWADDRGGHPASVGSTANGDDVGVLRIFFPGQGSGDELDTIEWDAFFDKFEEAKLAFVYETHTADGELSRFGKFVSR